MTTYDARSSQETLQSIDRTLEGVAESLTALAELAELVKPVYQTQAQPTPVLTVQGNLNDTEAAAIKHAFVAAWGDADVVVSTTFPLDAAQKKQIEDGFSPCAVRFLESPTERSER